MINKEIKQKAFTLVELLVVLVIITLLMTLSLLAIAYYRDKAKDIRTISSLGDIRKIGAIIYSDEDSYAPLCATDNTLDENNQKYPSVKAIEEDISVFSGQSVLCYASDKEFCVQGVLVGGGEYCVDSTGYAGRDNTNCADDHKRCVP